MARPEEIIESYFLRRVKSEFPEAQVHKYEVRRSEPDRICLFPKGRAIFVELKRPGMEPRPDQKRALMRLRNLGFHAVTIDTKAKVDDFIEDVKLWT
jgi:hypothetical protein